MGFLSSLASLFSNNTNSTPKQAVAEESIDYKGFSITPSPISEGGQFRLSAIISKEIDQILATHTFIRSDVISSRDECIAITVRKAKIAIDQMGENIFK